MRETRYFLKADHEADFSVVTKEQFVRAERIAGFRNTMGQPNEPATAGFGGRGIQGRVEYA